MKAVILESTNGPQGLAIRDIELPTPAPGEVRVRLHASALNRRDYWLTLGKYPKMQLPCIPGSDGAGVIEAVGAGVNDDLIGQEVVLYPAMNWGDDQSCYGPDFRVLGMPDQGTFAEAICIPAENVYPKPTHLDWFQAAAIPLSGLTAWRACVTQAEVCAGQRILITGAGSGVSSLAILWCLNLGAEVYVTSGNEAKLAAARQLGVSGAENYRDPDCYRKLRQQSGGFHAIIDSAGGNTVNALLDTLLHAGRYVFFGATLGNPEQGLEMPKLFFRHIRIQGTTMGSNAEFAAMLDFVDTHRIVPLVDRILPLHQAADAHVVLADFNQTGKIVLSNS
ncbi:MAG: alcohol dehydrogenase [Gammaproteobacteria bacterium]|nr:MAG: alcohol dehydrogenase [Gammaproteobacteria bacterium]